MEKIIFKQLPRDLQLSVIKRFDIDTRIKTKLIHKLKVPTDLSEKLNSLNQKRKLSFELRLREESTHIVTLRLGSHKFYECYYDKNDNELYWYYVDSTSYATQYAFPYLCMIYPLQTRRMMLTS